MTRLKQTKLNERKCAQRYKIQEGTSKRKRRQDKARQTRPDNPQCLHSVCMYLTDLESAEITKFEDTTLEGIGDSTTHRPSDYLDQVEIVFSHLGLLSSDTIFFLLLVLSSCVVLSDVLSCLVLSWVVLFCPVLSCVVLSCLVVSCLVGPCLVLSCPVFSCLVLSCVLSCLILSCLAFSCAILSCLVLPRVIF